MECEDEKDVIHDGEIFSPHGLCQKNYFLNFIKIQIIENSKNNHK